MQRECLERIVAAAAKHGAPVVVMLFPFESQVFLETYDDRPIRRLEALCDELGVRFVDLATAFRDRRDEGRRLFLKGDRFHPTAAGYAIVADRVRDALQGTE